MKVLTLTLQPEGETMDGLDAIAIVLVAVGYSMIGFLLGIIYAGFIGRRKP